MIKRAIIAICVTIFAVGPVLAGPNCKCRFNGTTYKLGEIACIRGKLSKCELNLNNTSWKTIANECPQVQLDQIPQTPRPDGQSGADGAQFASSAKTNLN